MKRIVIRYGLLMFAGLTALFVIMHILNLSQRYHLRLLNAVIHLICLTLAIGAARRERMKASADVQEADYMFEIAAGVLTSVFGALSFAVFQLIHLSINTEFMQYLKDNVPYVGQYLNPFTASVSIFMEGLAMSIVGSYIIARVINASESRKKAEPEHQVVHAPRDAHQWN